MIAKEKKKALLSAIERVEDEVAFARIEAVVAEVLEAAAAHNKFGAMQGTVEYLVDDWDAPLPAADWKAFQ